ncbi:MAG TPA: cell division protein FtsH [Verrucomicrobiales bacterium]|nr:cell division protein FtsH [Verrucomicrobiales bacterium]
MSDTNKNRDEEKRNGDLRNSPQRYLLWIAVAAMVPLLFMASRGNGPQGRTVQQPEFMVLVESNLVTEAMITYDPQAFLQEVQGKAYKHADGVKVSEGGKEVVEPFMARVRLPEQLELQLIRTGKFKVRQPNTVLLQLLWGVGPLVLIAIAIWFVFIRQIRMAGKGALSFGKSKARLLTKEKNKVTFKDVAGVDEAKEEVSELVEFLRDPKKFQKLGGRIPKGILMVGAPGTGKTLLAKAIAGEADAAFFSISGSDFVEMFVGVGASRVRDMFEQARKNTPCLVFIDEIDAVGRSRGVGLGGGNDEREQTLNALLVEMDGFDTTEGIIIIAATNRPDVLDPALLRPGRFDRQVSVPLPDIRGRESILKVHAKNVKLENGVDLSVIARGTPGFSGAELANLLNEAALLAARQNKKAVGMPELEEARDKVRWGRERRSLAMTEEEKRFTAWHEAGHALLNVLCENTHPLHKVTIIPRGQALGATMNLPKEDVWSHRRKQLLDQLCMIMGGRIAEEMISGDISSGASMDIQQATNIARAMVCQFGMSTKLGMIQFGNDDEVFLGREMMRRKDYSDDTARQIDAEVKSLIDGAFQRASDLLQTHRDKLEMIANALLEHETLDGKQVEDIVRNGRFTPPEIPKDVDPPRGAQAATPLPEVVKPTPPKIGPGLGSAAPATA